jgi:hypothetical protein
MAYTPSALSRKQFWFSKFVIAVYIYRYYISRCCIPCYAAKIFKTTHNSEQRDHSTGYTKIH